MYTYIHRTCIRLDHETWHPRSTGLGQGSMTVSMSGWWSPWPLCPLRWHGPSQTLQAMAVPSGVPSGLVFWSRNFVVHIGDCRYCTTYNQSTSSLSSEPPILKWLLWIGTFLIDQLLPCVVKVDQKQLVLWSDSFDIYMWWIIGVPVWFDCFS